MLSRSTDASRRPSALVVGAALGVAAFAANAVDRLARTAEAGGDTGPGPALVVDALLGLCSLVLLTRRDQRPLLVASLTTALMAGSAASFGPAVVALYSLALLRSGRRVMVVGAVFLVSQVVAEASSVASSEPGASADPGDLAVGVLVLAVPVAVGYYISARRQLIAMLEERARTAEREQALVAEAAREAERTRIAREMHDVLAHRISLVALHAGALAYRDDLTPAETAETAATIQANAQLALAELRQVLGVLRAGPASDLAVAAVEAPQPTLAELPALLADAREAGMTVRLEAGPLGRRGRAPALSTTLSRTAFRIVQEALTNARKHAPGSPVDVRLTGSPGGALEVEVRNAALPGAAPDPSPSAGVGLLGLDERAQLVGGRLVHGLQPDGTFIVGAWLPWR